MAQGWRERIVAGQIYSIQQLASEAKLNFRYAARIFRLATLSPEIVDAIVDQGSMADQPLRHYPLNKEGADTASDQTRGDTILPGPPNRGTCRCHLQRADRGWHFQAI